MSVTAIRRALGLNVGQAQALGLIAAPRRGAASPPRRIGRGPVAGLEMIEVVEVAARTCGLDRQRLLSRAQVRRLTRARQLAIILLRELCPGASLMAVGSLLGRDHTTVLYGLRRARVLLAEDASFRALYERASRALLSSGAGADPGSDG